MRPEEGGASPHMILKSMTPFGKCNFFFKGKKQKKKQGMVVAQRPGKAKELKRMLHNLESVKFITCCGNKLYCLELWSSPMTFWAYWGASIYYREDNYWPQVLKVQICDPDPGLGSHPPTEAFNVFWINREWYPAGLMQKTSSEHSETQLEYKRSSH